MTTRPNIAERLVLAEASAWLVRLQGNERDPAHESAFRAWLAEDSAHARAFERATDTWEIIPAAARQSKEKVATKHKRAPRFMAVAASFVVLVATVMVSLPTWHDPRYQTQVGEQQIVVLDDGTRVTLNTGTRLSVDYRPDLRRIQLDYGEALFEVAKNKARPFIVQAGHEQVTAIGTSFVVRRDGDRLNVLLLEGRVLVGGSVPAKEHALEAEATTLEPGDRLTMKEGASAHMVDRPSVEAATAWRRGEAMFDNVSLEEAVAEINRYGKVHVSVNDPAVASLRISGVFSIRDPIEFANVIAKLHNLDVVRATDGVVLKAHKT